MPVELVQKKLVELCGLYSENAIDLISAFASTMIFADNIKKGVAIYEDLIEKNQFDILLYLRLCEALENVDEFELEKEYLNKAIDLAKINDDEVALELLENSLNYILKHIEKKPYEVVNMNIPTIMELIDNQVKEHIKVKHPEAQLVNFLTNSNYEDIKHAYDKYIGIENALVNIN